VRRGAGELAGRQHIDDAAGAHEHVGQATGGSGSVDDEPTPDEKVD
jgi:hypothetical protein